MNLIDTYITAWNERDADKRRSLIERVFVEDAHYLDPLADVAGWDAIDDMISAAQAQFAGFAFRLRGAVDAHHELARFQWQRDQRRPNPSSWALMSPCLRMTGESWRFTDFLTKCRGEQRYLPDHALRSGTSRKHHLGLSDGCHSASLIRRAILRTRRLASNTPESTTSGVIATPHAAR